MAQGQADTRFVAGMRFGLCKVNDVIRHDVIPNIQTPLTSVNGVVGRTHPKTVLDNHECRISAIDSSSNQMYLGFSDVF